MKKMGHDKWDAVLSTNLDSVFYVTKQFLDQMIDANYGRIVNVSSINAQKGQFGQVNYSAAKAGIHGFTKALAQEVARKGITVNTISPGYVATSMVMAIDQSVRDQIIAQIPVGRLAEPAEIARAIAFLTAEEAGFMTGSNLAINGGQHMC
jgi:acetoacetyl-CoA reductase